LSNGFQSRAPITIEIEDLLHEGQLSISEIARRKQITRQRVQQIKRRLFTTSSPQPPQYTRPTDFAKEVAGISLMVSRREGPVWAKSDKALMLRCVEGKQMQRFKVAQMFWRERMSVIDIAEALDISQASIHSIIKRLRKKT
jgi:predicted DNA-binding protein YlxM (UPF0122 family)